METKKAMKYREYVFYTDSNGVRKLNAINLKAKLPNNVKKYETKSGLVWSPKTKTKYSGDFWSKFCLIDSDITFGTGLKETSCSTCRRLPTCGGGTGSCKDYLHEVKFPATNEINPLE